MDLGSESLLLQFIHCEIILLFFFSCLAYCMQDQTGAEYCPCLLSTHNSSLFGGHDLGFNSTGVTSIAYPGASVLGPSLHTPSYPKPYEEGSSFHLNQEGFANLNAIPSQTISCIYTSQVPTTAVSDKVFRDSGGNQDMCAYPASEPIEHWDTRVS